MQISTPFFITFLFSQTQFWDLFCLLGTGTGAIFSLSDLSPDSKTELFVF